VSASYRVTERLDVEQLGAGSGAEGVEASPELVGRVPQGALSGWLRRTGVPGRTPGCSQRRPLA